MQLHGPSWSLAPKISHLLCISKSFCSDGLENSYTSIAYHLTPRPPFLLPPLYFLPSKNVLIPRSAPPKKKKKKLK